MKTTSINKLLYSKQLGDYSSHVYIDGECVKSRMRSGEKPTIEKAIETGQTVLVQEGRKIKIYAEDDRFSFFEKFLNYNNYLRQATHDKNIILVRNPFRVKRQVF